LIVAPKRNRFVLAAALVAALFAGSFAPSYAFLDKTRFVAHLGIAWFAFHHFVWKPYQDGSFNNGAPHRVSSIVKGGVALLFAVHEVKVADKIAQTSSDPLLHKLDGALGGLQTQFSTIGSKLKGGNFDPKDIEGLNTATNGVGSAAASDGAPIKDVAVPIPSS
jgi:hypothetical protein